MFNEQLSEGAKKNAKRAKNTIYVAKSLSKVMRIQKYIRKTKHTSVFPVLTTVNPLFHHVYERLPITERIQLRVISETHARLIVRYILVKERHSLFSKGNFSLSPETSDFFTTWIRNIKEYNLHLTYTDMEIVYRKDATRFDLSHRENKFNEKLLSVLSKLFFLYEKFLLDNNLLDESDKKWWVIDHLSSTIIKRCSFYIEHLSILRTIEQVLFRKIYQIAKSVSLLDFSYEFPENQFTTTTIIEQDYVIEENLSGKNSQYPIIKLRKYQKKEHEIESIARKIDKQEITGDIVIVAPVIDEYESILQRVFARYHIAPPGLAYKKLSESPVIKSCMALFDLINERFRRRAMLSFLLSPFTSFFEQDERKHIDRLTRNEMIVDGNDWMKLKTNTPGIGKIIQLVRELSVLKTKKGIPFLDHYISLLLSLIHPEYEEEISAFNMILNYITSLTRKPIARTCSEFTLKDFQRIITTYIESARVRTGNPVDETIQLLDLEEASGMKFGSVFLVGLVEGKLPHEPQHNPLFSEKLLDEMGFPTYDMLYTLSKFNFENIMCGANTIFCSYYEKDERENIYMKSPFLQGIACTEEKNTDNGIQTVVDWQMRLGEIIHSGEELGEQFASQSMKERVLYIRDGIRRFYDEKRLRNVKDSILSGKEIEQCVVSTLNKLSKRISASFLETYKRCPYQFFLHYIVGLGETTEPEKGMDRGLRGRVIHAILARFFERRLHKKVQKSLRNNWGEMRTIAIDVIERLIPGKRDRILLKVELISKEHSSLLYKFLDFESEKHINHTISDTEWRFSGKDVSMIINGDKLGFVGIIDRIDKSPHGLIIYDYKTGSKTKLPRDSYIQEGTSFQLPLYALAVETCIGKVSETAYYLISNKDGVLTQQRKIISSQLLKSNIAQVWKAMNEFNFESQRTAQCTDFCPYLNLCPEFHRR